MNRQTVLFMSHTHTLGQLEDQPSGNWQMLVKSLSMGFEDRYHIYQAADSFGCGGKSHQE